MKLLIVVDMQRDFIDGCLGTKEAQAIVPRVKKKVEEYGNGYVIFTRDTHGADYLDTSEGKHLPVKHCIEGTPGWLICDELYNGVGYHIINKQSFGYTGWGDLELDETFDSVEIVGLCTDICVVSNALILKALYPELELIVDASCCAGSTPEAHAAALKTMRSCQINVIGG